TSAEGYLRDKARYQRTKRELSFLPFYEILHSDASKWLEQIKAGLAASTCVYAADHGLTFWLDQLKYYLDTFYLRFHREDHIRFVRFAYSLILEKDLNHRIVHKACSLIKSLINEEILNRKHLTLEWRPLYKLYTEIAYERNERNLDVSVVKDVAFTVKEFFPLSATGEILSEIRPYVDVWNDYAMERFIGLFAAFVPLKMSIDEHNKYGAALWFDELWYFYNLVEMNSSWECRIQCIFSAISEYCPGYIDWTPKHTIIFSKLLRTLNLSVRDGKISVGDGTGMGSETAGAEWIVWMLGGPNDSAEKHLSRVIRCIESFLHPLHDGLHTVTLQSFLAALVSEMVRRVRIERVRKKTKRKVPEWMRLTDKQIESFVSMLLPSVIYSAFSTVETSLPSCILRYLAFLAPNLVLPRVLDLVYPSLSTTTEPNRLKQSLECLVEICVPLIRDNGEFEYCNYNTCKRQWITEFQGSSLVCNKTAVTHRTLKTSAKMSTESVEVKRAHKAREPLRRHALVLLDALVSAIDINDVVKLSLAFRIIATFFTLFPIVDCSNAPNNQQYGILNEEEKSLCALTATIPRIITKLLDRVLTLISQLATAVPKDSTTCLDSICDVSGDVGFGSEDEILVNIRIQSTFRSLLNNSSPAIVQLVAEQIYHFAKTTPMENAVAADALCVLVQECTYASPERYFPLYLNHVMENLNDLSWEEKKHLEMLDAATMWYIFLGMVLFSVPSEIILKYREECVEIHKRAISVTCRNAYKAACWSLTNILTTLTEVYPLSEQDRQFTTCRPLDKSLSVRNWANPVAKDIVKMKWHIPDDEELRFAERLIEEFVYKEIHELQSPEKLDKKSIKRSLYIVEKLLFCVGKRLPNFTGPTISLAETDVPITARVLSAMPPGMKTFSLNGKNVREVVRETMHNLMRYSLRVHQDPSVNLERVISILHLLTTRGVYCIYSFAYLVNLEIAECSLTAKG
uniref:Proteasome activator Blm10 mid region domain-containing protein n=2 Tax=Parascaris univalens TaxID=6257 RepID=A0A915A5Y9_PARUN